MSPQSDRRVRCDLTLLATSDLHLNLCPWNFFADTAAPGTGLASAAERILRLRETEPNALLFDNGDTLQGTPLADALMAEGVGSGDLHPMINAMNLLRYDAMALGNHDFDFGLPYLARALAGAGFPALCANLQAMDGQPLPFRPWVILDRRVIDHAGHSRPLRLGVIGVVPPQPSLWAGSGLDGRLQMRGIVETVRAAIPQMQAQGAEIIVALCHSGIGLPEAAQTPTAENAALAVAALSGIDAVVAGHTHQIFPGRDILASVDIDPIAGRLAGRPACMPGHAASHLGMIRLTLELGADGRWHSLGGSGLAVPLIQGADPALPQEDLPAIPAAMQALCEQAGTTTRRHLGRLTGHSATPLSSHFALAGDCSATLLVTQAMRAHVQQALRGTACESLPVLAAAAAIRIGGRGGPQNYTDLAAGALCERDMAALVPFSDGLRALRMTGAELTEWLEHSAGAFLQILPDSCDTALLDPARPGYNFDLIDGLTYCIDLTQPARRDAGGRCINPQARRIVNLRHQGRPVQPEDPFILAMSSYRASGGGGFPVPTDPARRLVTSPRPIRSIVSQYLAQRGIYSPPPEPIWRFAPIPGASAVLLTGPGAARHLPRPGMTPVGYGEDGFLRVRVAL